MKIVQKKERRDRSQKAIEILANILMGLFCVLIILPCMNLISQAVSPGGDVVGGKVYFWPTGIHSRQNQFFHGNEEFPDCDRVRNLDQCNSDDYDILSAISSGILWSKVFHIPICIQYDLFRGYDPSIYGCEDIGTD